jgi:Arc/MetJ-type ribon-helix-helix transcriptional regulator
MSASRTVTLGLSEEQAQWIDERIAEGEYATATEALLDGLKALIRGSDIKEPSQDKLSDEEVAEAVRPALERLRNGSARYYTSEQVRQHLDELASTYTAPA